MSGRPPKATTHACHRNHRCPTFAHQARQLDPSAALVLPCNVVLEPDASGGTRISVVDPRELMPDPAFAELAGAAAAQLAAALDALNA